MVNIDSLHNWVMSMLEEKRKSVTTLQNCSDEKERKKLEIMFIKKFRNLPVESEYLFDIMKLEKIKTIEMDEDEKNEYYYDFVRRHFSNTLDIETLELIKRGGLNEAAFQIKKERDKMYRCKSCKSDNFLISCTKQSLMICGDCGTCLDDMNHLPSWEQERDIPRKKSGYTKQKTMNEALDYFLCRKKCTVDNDKIIQLRYKLNHIPQEYLTIKMMKIAMKELSMNKVYIQMYLLFFQLTNKKVDLDMSTEKILHFLFYLVKEAFSELRIDGIIKRTNIFIYKYSIFKLLEIILYLFDTVCVKKQTSVFLVVDDDDDDDKPHNFQNNLTPSKLAKVNTAQVKYALTMIPYPVIESHENLIKYDTDWSCICKKCNFPFFESV